MVITQKQKVKRYYGRVCPFHNSAGHRQQPSGYGAERKGTGSQREAPSPISSGASGYASRGDEGGIFNKKGLQKLPVGLHFQSSATYDLTRWNGMKGGAADVGLASPPVPVPVHFQGQSFWNEMNYSERGLIDVNTGGQGYIRVCKSSERNPKSEALEEKSFIGLSLD